MKRVSTYCLWILMAACCGLSVYAQEPAEGREQSASDSSIAVPVSINEPAYFISKIEITGNGKTKARIILREIPFKEGETYTLQELVKKLEAGRELLMNMSLFHTVAVAVKNYDGNSVTIGIELRERWYLFPVPYFKPVDRNLNQWVFEQKGSIDRVNYGIKVSYNNVTGRNDKFRLWLMNGYTRQIAFSYSRPYF